MKDNKLSVTQLSNYIKSLLEDDVLLQKLVVVGELSNFKVHSSGHCYFSLKDENSVISAVMFRRDASKLKFKPESGMKIVLKGRVSLFPKSGQYQIYVTDMEPDGIGSLYVAFEQLKEKLYNEGLFDSKHKKTLPKFPNRIGLITSPTGAAVRDMIRIIKSRYKPANIIVFPVLVQGETAGKSIAKMINYVSKNKLCDVIICGRGGGSMEDLWCFNEEIVARATFDCEIPIISAVGHEPDVTIIDYVADVRAATPSNAGEIATSDGIEILLRLNEIKKKLYLSEMVKIENYMERLKNIEKDRLPNASKTYFNTKMMTLTLEEHKLVNHMEKQLQLKTAYYTKITAMLDALSPLKVISRGYGLVEKQGEIVRSIEQLKKDDVMSVKLSDGVVCSKVIKIEENL